MQILEHYFMTNLVVLSLRRWFTSSDRLQLSRPWIPLPDGSHRPFLLPSLSTLLIIISVRACADLLISHLKEVSPLSPTHTNEVNRSGYIAEIVSESQTPIPEPHKGSSITITSC